MLIEALISMVIFAIVFSALGLALQQSVVATRQSKDLQSATQLVNRQLEQARAIAGDTLLAGASTSDIAAAISSGAETRLSGANPYTYNGETVLTSASPASGTPLNPYRAQQPVDGLTVWLSTYATRCYQPVANPGGCQATPSSSPTTDKALVRITVVGEWTVLGSSIKRTITNQSLAFSPTSCLSSSTHPFSAPCQTFVYGGANAAGGSLSIQGFDTGGVNSLELRLPDASTSLQVEQTGRAKAVVAGSSILQDGTATDGGVTQTSLSTSDPAQTTTAASNPLPAAPAITRQLAGANGLNGLALTATGAAATGTAVAAMRSSSSPVCASASGVSQSTGYPACASASVTPTGPSGLSISGSLDGIDLATTLASVASPTSVSRSHVGFYTQANGASLCAQATSAGCVAGDLQSMAGAVSIGGLPTGMSAPAGWSGGAVLVDANQANATSERGSGAVSPAATPTVTGTSPTLRVWNGTGYDSIPLTTTTDLTTRTIPAVSVTASGLNFELRGPPGPGGEPASDAGTVTLGERADTETGPADCSAVCGLTGAIGPLTVTLNYAVSRGSTSLGRFVVNVTLYDQQSRATFEPKPAAGS